METQTFEKGTGDNKPKLKFWHFIIAYFIFLLGYEIYKAQTKEARTNEEINSELINKKTNHEKITQQEITDEETNNEDGKKPEEMSSEAYVTAQTFMKKHLKAPSTADFPLLDYKFIASNRTYHFIIKSYVDAQNSFGAQIRTYYLVQMKWNGKDWSDISNWTLIDIATDENEF